MIRIKSRIKGEIKNITKIISRIRTEDKTEDKAGDKARDKAGNKAEDKIRTGTKKKFVNIIAKVWICCSCFFLINPHEWIPCNGAVMKIRDSPGIYEEEGNENLFYQTEFFLDDEMRHIPPETLIYRGEVFHRHNYEPHSDITPRTQHFKRKYIYTDVEAYDIIPSVREFDVIDEQSGRAVSAELPLKGFSYQDMHWENSFSFPITVEHADAEIWTLNEKSMNALEQQGEYPFQGYESTFLEYLGLSEEDYHITDMQWTSEPWESDGIVYRAALARGEKRIASVEAIYEGDVIVSAESEKVITAIYKKNKPDTDLSAENHKNYDENHFVNDKDKWWKRLYHNIWNMLRKYKTQSIFISIILILVGMIAIVYAWKKRRKKVTRYKG